MSLAEEIAAALSAIPERSAGSDAERRAALLVAKELTSTGQRGAVLETFWCRPNWALAQAWHVALGLGGSLASVSDPVLGAILVAVALLALACDALFGVSPGRRLTPERASQNVVSPAPTGGSGGSPPAPLELVITANLDAGREGLAYRPGLRRSVIRLRHLFAGRPPGWAGWLAIALAWTLAVALMRTGGGSDAALSIAQLPPAIGLVIALAILLELAGDGPSPGAGDNAAGVGVAVALARALDAAPPANLSVSLVLTGAGDGQALGLRSHLRRHRHEHGRRSVVVLGIGPSGGGEPRWLISDGALIPLAYARTLRRLCAEIAGQAPGLHLRPLRARGSGPALAARHLGVAAIGLQCADADGLVPRSHTAADTADRLDPAAVAALLQSSLLFADALDELTPA